jgi:hypothetical protein
LGTIQSIAYYDAWVLHFLESTGTGYVPDTGTRMVLLGYALMTYLFFYFLFCNGYTLGTPMVRAWYSCGTRIQKNTIFFFFSFIHFFVYRKIYDFYLFNIKVAALVISNNKVVVEFIHSFIGKK